MVNPQHVKALPGHKTDRVDAARIAELLQYDLLRASFVPPQEIRELRDLVSIRRQNGPRPAATFECHEAALAFVGLLDGERIWLPITPESPTAFTGCWS